jgi:uncharacterized protein YbjT (DUF2867 family)
MAGLLIIFGTSGNVVKALLSSLCQEQTSQHPQPSSTSKRSLRIVTRDTRDGPSAETLGLRPEDWSVETVQGSVTDPKETLVAALSGGRKVFCAFPQCLSSEQMVAHGRTFTDACAEARVASIVHIASFGIDGCLSQGPLGDAHTDTEGYMKQLGLAVTSVRPTSFFSNFLKYDVPPLRAGASFTSPLGNGAAARVNWIACEGDHAARAAAPCGIRRRVGFGSRAQT